jgi:hypothetical protein
MPTHALHRTTVLRAVRAVENGVSPATELPWDTELAATYGTRDALLVALHDHWSRQLLSRIDVALELGAETPEASVAVAWRSAVRDQPGVHHLLEAEADHPALRASRRSLLATVAVAAGLATFDDPAWVSVAAGERLLASLDATTDVVRVPSRLARLLRKLWDGGPTPDPYPWAA